MSAWCKTCTSARNREWQKNHPEHYKKLTRRWQHKHHDRYRECQRKFFRSELGLAASYRKRARRLGAKLKGAHTADEWRAKCDEFGNRCACCRGKLPLTRDHIVPISKGGSNAIENLQPLCRECNSRKRDQTIAYAPAA